LIVTSRDMYNFDINFMQQVVNLWLENDEYLLSEWIWINHPIVIIYYDDTLFTY